MPATRRPTVLIADDHALMLEQLVNLLKERYEIVGTVTTGDGLLEAVDRLQPDVVVTDLSMPGLNGLEALRRLKAARAETIVIILTAGSDTELARYAIGAGASGFMTKFSAFNELAIAVDGALHGRIHVPGAATGA